VLVSALLAQLIAGRLGLTWLQAAIVALPVALVYAFVCLSAWYVARGLPIKTTATARIVLTGLLSSMLSSAVWLAVAGFWLSTLVGRGWLPESARGGGYQSLIFGFGVLLYLLSLAVGYLLVMFEENRAADRLTLQVQVLAREAELRSLRSQLDPHFLFNCLHSISALTTADPPAARRMCLLLAEFLRETLALGSEGRITVAREMKLVDRFLSVERIRFGDRLDVDLSAAADAEMCLVPPLLLQPLVENAVTHGIAHILERGTIRIAASRSPARLSIVVENPCDPERPRGTGAGVGVSNVQARLRALYGAEAIVKSSEEGGVWRMELSFPATTGPA
jgi:sensor histidine kinase YesM